MRTTNREKPIKAGKRHRPILKTRVNENSDKERDDDIIVIGNNTLCTLLPKTGKDRYASWIPCSLMRS